MMCPYCTKPREEGHWHWCPELTKMNNCNLCERDVSQFGSTCHYVNCPHRKKGSSNLPVKVMHNNLRTLWVVTDRNDLKGHTAYQDLFDGCMVLKPESIIRPKDVIFFDGGTDVNPALYGEEPHVATSHPDTTRDHNEVKAFVRGREAGAFFLGTCRGAQLLCALSGGKLVQHATGHGHGGHMLFSEQAPEGMYTESSHHQIMCPGSINHELIAYADTLAQEAFKISDEYGKTFEDGHFPEIIYCKDTRALCIQGHAEWVNVDSDFYKFTRNLARKYLELK